MVSYECKKTIPLIDTSGFTVFFTLYILKCKSYKKISETPENNKTILRHFDMEEISKFIKYVHKRYIKENLNMTIIFKI